MATPRERFEAITHEWWLSEPALFAVFCTHNLHENNSLPIPLRSGKGRIEYSTQQVDLLSDPALEQLLKVEMIRLCLRHPYERQPTGCCAKALHMGSDMVIEPAYRVPLAELSKPGDMQLPQGQHFEWYADRVNDILRQTMKLQCQMDESEESDEQGSSSVESDNGGKKDGDQEEYDSNSKPQNGNAQSGKDGARGDDDSQTDGCEGDQGDEPQKGSQSKDGSGNGKTWESGDTGEQEGRGQSGSEDMGTQFGGDPYVGLWQEDEEMKEILKEHLEKVTNWGSIPSHMVEVIQKALVARIDYRKVLRAYQTSIISTNRNLTRMRPNRRFGFDAMGSKHDMSSRLLVAVDVSGSVSDQALSKFFRVVSDFFKYGVEEIDVLQFDAAVSKDVVQLKKYSKEVRTSKVEIMGRGGTNFQCVVDYLREHNNYDGLIIFTDGYAPTPTINFHTRAKLLWVTETEEEYNQHKDWMKNTGRACFIM